MLAMRMLTHSGIRAVGSGPRFVLARRFLSSQGPPVGEAARRIELSDQDQNGNGENPEEDGPFKGPGWDKAWRMEKVRMFSYVFVMVFSCAPFWHKPTRDWIISLRPWVVYQPMQDIPRMEELQAELQLEAIKKEYENTSKDGEYEH